ncbi:hypothetical protein KVT40_000731 [Elsinoe batatas]|uniref:Uncharacterized protein n=1 Tax=Elsinoe batatas TaxID=2601811 RepID=A0A8K0PIX2_9PEZI|nr:hypothetical protein KVT40_000731 [Elsinoe batatas]
MPPRRTRAAAAPAPQSAKSAPEPKGRTTRRAATNTEAEDAPSVEKPKTQEAAKSVTKSKQLAPKTSPKVATKTQPTRGRKAKSEIDNEDEEQDEDEDVTGGLVRNAPSRRARQDPIARVSGALSVGGRQAGTEQVDTGDEFDVPDSQGETATTASKSKTTGKRRSSAAKTPAAHRKTQTPAKSSTRKTEGAGKTTSTPRSAVKSAKKIGFTPLAGDSSVQALQMFRMRPRQNSILTAVRGGILDTSVLDQTDSLMGGTEELGTSALDTTADVTGTTDARDTTNQVPEPETTEDNGGPALDLGEELGDMTMDDEAFRPDLEGTPLPGRFEPTVTEAERRKSLYDDDEDLYVVSPRKKRGTKRKSDEISSDHDSPEMQDTQDQATQRTTGGTAVEVMRSSPPAPEPRSRGRGTARSGSSSDLSAARSASLPPLDAESSGRSSPPRHNDLDSDVYADPRSDSSVSDEVKIIPSPKKRRGTAAARPEQEKRMTSAMLRSLLPRRLVKRDESFDVSGIESDEDNRPTKKTSRRVLGEAKGKKNMKLSTSRTSCRTKPSRTTRGEEKENAEGDVVDPGKGKRKTQGSKAPKVSSKTYGRSRRDQSEEQGSDDEGEGLSKELQAARDKFKQIDQAALEFDSASISGGSSPWR